MGRFISNFQTTAEFLSFSKTTGFSTPHVSMTKDTSELHYFEKIESQYRWVDDGYTCVGYDKYTQQKQQISNDSGETWTDTGVVSAVTLVEENSEYCGYVPPTPTETRVVATFNVTSTSSRTKIANDTTGFSSIEIDGVEQSSVTTGYTLDTLGEHTVKYTLTDSTSIGTRTFYYCPNLTIIDIPDNVTSIGDDAFRECGSLTTCAIGNGVTSIGASAFYQCSGLTSVTIPDSVTSIGDIAFSDCKGLTSIDIPNSVTSIGNSAFASCSSLTSITVGNNNAIYDSRGNCNAIIKTSTNSLIVGCKNTVIPNNVTSIGNDAFRDCSGLTNIDIPNSVTSIGNYTFQFCTSLTSIVIPDSVTSIGDYAFYCESLTSITVNAVTPPTIGINIIDGTCGKGSGSGSGSGSTPPAIYVPSGSVDTYKAASGWSDYECKIQPIQ